MSRGRLFCFGFGYTAQHLARRLAARGFDIAGTSRQTPQEHTVPEKCALYHFESKQPMQAADRALAGTTHLLVSIRPDQDRDPVLQWHEKLIARLPNLEWIGYLSTTGVYGNHAGAWVTEDAPRKANKPRTRRRCTAEDQWLALGARIFRLAGIYGPGRSAIERVAEGGAQRIVKPGKYFNRIHVADIARVLEASITSTASPSQVGGVYNVADGHPAASEEVLSYAAELLGVPPPPIVAFEQAELSAMARSFWEDNVRIDNSRIRQELGVELHFPSYREGLADCLAHRAREP